MSTGINITAGTGNDQVEGSSLDDTLLGGSEDDALYGHAGNDSMDGGSGRDHLEGMDGDDTLEGGSGADTAYAGTGNDSVVGGTGDDYLDGGDGHDALEGGDGDDVLLGEAGNDSLSGGAGDDSLYGGAGSDTYFFGRGSGADTIDNWHYDGSAQADTLRLTGLNVADVAMHREGFDLVIAVLGSTDVLRVTSYFDGEGDPASMYRLDTIMFEDGTNWGFADVQAALPGPTEGHDSIYGSGGDDALDALAGNDQVSAGSGNDSIAGGGGSDTLSGEAGNDTIDGGAGADDLYGGADDDSLTGGLGSDQLQGDDGDDTLIGGGGNDTLYGGTGADTFVFGRGSGDDSIHEWNYDGASSVDVLQLAGLNPADVTVSRESWSNLRITIGDTGESLWIVDYFAGGDPGNGHVEQLVFADGTVWSFAEVSAVVAAGSDADDFLLGSPGADSLAGGAGADNLSGGDGNDTLDGGAGNDAVYGEAGDDALAGGAGDDYLEGGDGADTLAGGAGDDQLSGNYGADVYVFGRGSGHDSISNYAYGDLAGLDRIELNGLDPADVLARQEADDLVLTVRDSGETLRVSGYFSEEGSSVYGFTVGTIAFADGTSWSYADAVEAVLQPTDGSDQLIGGAADDSLAAGAGDDLLSGRAGNDSLAGDAGADNLSGGAGDDVLEGGAGNDYLQGDAGSDTYVFGRGQGDDSVWNEAWGDIATIDTVQLVGLNPDDVILRKEGDYSSDGNSGQLVIIIRDTGERLTVQNHFGGLPESHDAIDQIVFADGTVWGAAEIGAAILASTAEADSIQGSSGADGVALQDGDDTVYGYAGNDTLDGGTGDDYLDGVGDDDSLAGGAGSDNLYGGDGNDVLQGDAGDDYLQGGNGDDTLDGGLGNDQLSGGYGFDTYVFGRGQGRDTIDNSAYGDTVGPDRVELTDVASTDVTFWQDSYDLVLRINDTSDELRISGYFYETDIDPGRYAALEFAFADGITRNYPDVVANLGSAPTSEAPLATDGDDSLVGGAGDDNLTAQDGNDTLDGGTGNDWLDGGAGADTYVFRRGSGIDTIYNDPDTDSGSDNILLEGLLPSDVIVQRVGDDLRISIADTGDQLSLRDFFFYPVAQVTFGDGEVWTAAQLADAIVYTTSGDDPIFGSVAADSLAGAAGDDTLLGGDGDDSLDGGTGHDSLVGGDGADQLQGGSGNDVLLGDTGNDTLDGGGGSDDLQGGLGDDSYVFTRGSGADQAVVRESSSSDDGFDQVLLSGLNVADVTVRREGDDLVFDVNGTTDSLRVAGYFEGAVDASFAPGIEQIVFADGTTWGFADVRAAVRAGTAGDDVLQGDTTADTLAGAEGHDTLIGGEGDDALDGGAGNDYLQGEVGNDALAGGSDADNLYGSDGDDTLDGGSGDDYLSGDYGSDTYLFGLGSGNDLLYNGTYGDSGSTDRIELSGLNAGDVAMRREGSDLVISVRGATDTLRVIDYFSGEGTSSYGELVQEIAFADGTVWGYADVAGAVLTGTEDGESLYGHSGDDSLSGLGGDDNLYDDSGNNVLAGDAGDDSLTAGSGNDQLLGGSGDDWLDGGAGDDTLDGGAGADDLRGSAGSDTYVFGLGSGSDSIDNSDGDWGDSGVDTIELAGLTPADVVVTREYDDLLITITQSSETLRVSSYFAQNGASPWGYAVDQVVFADGTVWTYGDLAAATDDGVPDNLVFYGSEDAESLAGGDGDDALYGDGGDDTLAGGAGDDQLEGGSGNDTYVFGAGSGNDQIANWADDAATAIDTIQLQGLNPGDVTVARPSYWYGGGSEDLLITVKATGETLRVQGQFGGDGTIAQVVFADGTVWTADDIALATLATGTGDDSIGGFESSDSIALGDGEDAAWGAGNDDTLAGEAGNDTLFGDAGDDSLSGGSEDDSLQGGDGNDLLDGGSGNDSLEGAAGDDSLLGADGNDSLFGGEGNDAIDGGAGDDFIQPGSGDNGIWGGDGNDSIVVGGYGNGLSDTVDGGSGYDSVLYDYSSDFAPVVFEATGAGGSQVDPTSGLTDTFTNVEQLQVRGTDGADQITGDAQDNLFEGRGGDDTLAGGAGNDVFVFDYWDYELGRDRITDFGEGDALQLRGFSIYDVVDGTDPDLLAWNQAMVATGTETTTLYVNGPNGVVAIDLAGSFTAAQFRVVQDGTGSTLSLGAQPTEGDDTLEGGSGNDTIYALGGNDVVNAGAGNDSVYGGAGDDFIAAGGSSSGGSDLIDGGDGYDSASYDYSGETAPVVFTATGASGTQADPLDGSTDTLVDIEELAITGTDSGDQISGDAQRQFITGRGGDDTLAGGGGDDTFSYRIDLDNGRDRITDFSVGDSLQFQDATLSGVVLQGDDPSTLQAGDVMVGSTVDGVTTVYVQVGGATGPNLVTIELEGSFDAAGFSASNDAYGSNLSYSNGATGATEGNDTLTGGSGDETIDGLGGDDFIDGAGGNDTVDGGAGNDFIAAGGSWSGGADVIDGGDGYDSAGYDFSGQAEGVVFTATGVFGYQADPVDGSTDSLANIEELSITGSDLGDQVSGDIGRQFITGRGGDDTLAGGGGDDTFSYRVDLDNGRDHIADFSVGDTLRFQDFTLSGVVLQGDDPSALQLGEVMVGSTLDGVTTVYVKVGGGMAGVPDTGGAGLITIDLAGSFNAGQFTASSDAFGSELHYAAGATEGDDHLTGNAGDNLIDALGGNDFVNAGDGNDTVLGGAGDDFVLAGGSAGGADSLDGGAGYDTVLYDFGTQYGTVTFTATGATGLQLDPIDGTTDTLAGFEQLSIVGGYAGDQLSGDAMQNWIEGGGGDDTLTGGGGNDTFGFQATMPQGRDRITDLGADDTLSFRDFGISDLLSGDDPSGLQVGQAMVGTPADGVTTLYVRLNTSPDGLTAIDLDGSFTVQDFTVVNDAYGAQLRVSAGATEGNDTLDGGGSDDAIDGLGGNDWIDGGAGNDTLAGSGGNDTLLGGDGDDALYGGTGSDVLVGGAGSDTLDGGAITDRVNFTDLNSVNYSQSASGIVLDLESGVVQDGSGSTDFVSNVNFVTGSGHDDRLTGNGSDLGLFEQFDGGAGNDTIDGGAIDPFSQRNGNRVSYYSAGSAVDVTLDPEGTGSASGGGGDDVLYNINHVTGSRYDDTLTGSDSPVLVEHFNGRAGDDTIDGRGGVDVVRYDNAPAGASVNVDLGAGVASDGEGGTDTLSNIEGVRGSGGDDVLTGGNADNDAFEFFMGMAGDDTIDGGSGYDRADYTSATSGVQVTLGGPGSDGIALDGMGGVDTLRNIEALRGSSHDDTLSGSDTNAFESFDGFAGDDVIDGRGGEDRVDFQDAMDAAVVDLGAGIATGGWGGTKTLLDIEDARGSHFGDQLTGSAGANVLSGEGGDDSISGGDGSDTLVGGEGDDILVGGAGADYFDYSAVFASGRDSIVDFGAGDQLSIRDLALEATVRQGGDTSTLATGEAMLANPVDGVTTLYIQTGDGLLTIDLEGEYAASDFEVGGNGTDSTLSLVVPNTAPEAAPDTIDAIEDTELVFAQAHLLLNDFDPDDDTLTVTAVGDAQNGTVTLSGEDVIFTPDADFVGEATFSYTVEDGRGGSSSSTVTVNVEPADDAPIAADDVLSTELGTPVTVEAGTLLANDSDPDGDPLSLVAVGDAVNGTVTLANGKVTFTPAAGFIGSASFSYTVSDGTGATSTATATVLVAAADDYLAGTDGAELLDGKGGQDTLLGMGGNDTLVGGAGNDSLDGGAGADSMLGGAGDDTYVVDAGDTVVENPDEGRDTVLANVTWTLDANFENLTLTGSAAISATGNALDNVLVGNAAANELDGRGGVDQMAGGDGNDTYTVADAGDLVSENAGEGTDTVLSSVTHALAANVERLTLTGSAAINGTGNDLDNVLRGNSGNNVLAGAAGDDTYVVGSGDTVVENAGEGRDTVLASVAWTLAANVEVLTLTGSAAIDGTGNALDNAITGNAGANTLDGGSGDDTLAGGRGDDSYGVDSLGDVVSENAGEGTDTVRAGLTWTLGANLENLVLTGAADVDGTGNALANVLTGNAGANTLDGGAGADTLAGGAGNDGYVVDDAGDMVAESAGQGTDTVLAAVTYTLGANVENLTLTGTDAIAGTGNDLANILRGNDAANLLSGGDGNDLYFVTLGDKVVEMSGEGTDKVFSGVSWTLAANIENLTLTGSASTSATGNGSNNVLTGNSAANVLDGKAGADRMSGDRGNDSYYVNSVGDSVVEEAGEGSDTVLSTITYTLGANIEKLTLTGSAAIDGNGNALDNVLRGNSASNVLAGAAGDDTYVVGSGDTVVENAGEGYDAVLAGIAWTLDANVEALTLTGAAAIAGTGNALDNAITGNAGANALDGGGGADTLAGGAGDDSYAVDSLDDVVSEAAGEGTDTVRAGLTWTLGANLENLVLAGTVGIDGTGNALANVLTGNAGANTLDGGAGADTLAGGAGNDGYAVDDAGDVVVENAGDGRDTVLATVSYTLGANVENLTLTGTDAIAGTGNDLANVLRGNAAANVLAGAAGDDSYFVDVGDTVVETAGGGTDTVRSSINWALEENVENLVLTGSAAVDGAGNGLDNTITGNAASNVLDGGAGADTLAGGRGDDTYVVDTGDVVVEDAGEGTDTVRTAVSFTLAANLENLVLTGTAAVAGTGNALDNVLTGNSAGNKLAGGAGDDTYQVGSGDTVVESAGEGTDTVVAEINWTLAANLENVTLTGGAVRANGNTLGNVLTGSDGDNVLDGRAGADTLRGGLGDDTYLVDNAGDVVVEAVDAGSDTVQSSVSVTLAANVENLALTGNAAIDGTGNGLANRLSGNSAANVLSGGAGDDTYVVGAGDTVVENAGEGTDTVLANISWTLAGGVENLTLFGNGAIDGTGNALANVLTGNAAANTLDGAAGADSMAGGLGDDTYLVDAVGDVVTEQADQGSDTVLASVSYTLGSNLENLTLAGTAAIDGTGNELANRLAGNAGANVLAGGAGDDSYAVDSGDTIVENAGEGNDTVLAGVTWTLAGELENLTLTGSDSVSGTGNTLANVLAGNAGANLLDGQAGADTMAGGGGDDIYVVDDAGDVVDEGAGNGTDTVQATADYVLGDNVEILTLVGTGLRGTGNALDNVLRGTDGDDILDGGAGADTLIGALGDDSYVVDNAGDVVTENAGEGTDTVLAADSYVLGAHLERLTLTGTAAIDGTGNALANRLTGNAAANRLDGGAGVDTLAGGLGDDSYVVRQARDSAVEQDGEGTDTVFASVSHVLGANVENLTLIGAGSTNGVGNVLDNELVGNAGSNRLDGRSGADRMSGGAGHDLYVVDDAGDVVVELAGSGVDTIASLVSQALAANVEILQLTGSAAIDGSGNTGDNLLRGNAAANGLAGQGGNDLLLGLGGDDTLSDTQGNNALDGGAGVDALDGGAGNDFLAAGTGDDTVDAGGGADIIAFNAGDGLDAVTSAGAGEDTLSLGQVLFADLQLSRSGDDLALSTGAGEGVVLKDWFAGQRGVGTLQVVIDGTGDYDAGSDDVMHNGQVVQFDFAGLAARFEAEGGAGPWNLEPALSDFFLDSSDAAAMGGDLAVRYAHEGSLAAAGLQATVALMGAPEFGLANQDLAVL